MNIKSIASNTVTHGRDGIGWGLQKMSSGIQYGGEHLSIKRMSLAKVSTTVLVGLISYFALALLQAAIVMPATAAFIVGTWQIPVATAVNTGFIFTHNKVLWICKDVFFSPISKASFTNSEYAKEGMSCILFAIGRWTHQLGEKCKVHKTSTVQISSIASVILKAGLMTLQGWAISTAIPPIGFLPGYVSIEALQITMDKYLKINLIINTFNAALDFIISPEKKS